MSVAPPPPRAGAGPQDDAEGDGGLEEIGPPRRGEEGHRAVVEGVRGHGWRVAETEDHQSDENVGPEPQDEWEPAQGPAATEEHAGEAPDHRPGDDRRQRHDLRSPVGGPGGGEPPHHCGDGTYRHPGHACQLGCHATPRAAQHARGPGGQLLDPAPCANARQVGRRGDHDGQHHEEGATHHRIRLAPHIRPDVPVAPDNRDGGHGRRDGEHARIPPGGHHQASRPPLRRPHAGTRTSGRRQWASRVRQALECCPRTAPGPGRGSARGQPWLRRPRGGASR